MLRRRLRLTCFSDEEEDDDPQQQNAIPPEQFTSDQNPNPNPSEPLEISDDDEFIDVSDNISPPPPPPQPPHISDQTPPESISGGSNVNYSPIEGHLEKLGLKLRREWLDCCVTGLEGSVPGFRSLDVGAKAKHCFEQFLYSDMNCSGGGALPENISAMHLVDLPGPFVLQVDEIVNISSALRGRYQNASAGMKRCLKLSMTDGIQRVFGMEYRPIKDLEVLSPAGLKVVVCNVHIRHGLLMLVPEVIEVLGGLVEELKAARQRLVNEINKPPRGKRTRTGVVPALATRATLAAWPSNAGVNLHPTNSDLLTNANVSQNSNSFQANDPRVPSPASFVHTRENRFEKHTVPTTRNGGNSTNVVLAASYVGTSENSFEERAVPTLRDSAELIYSNNDVLAPSFVDTRENRFEERAFPTPRNSAERITNDVLAASYVDTHENRFKEHSIPTPRNSAECIYSTNDVLNAEDVLMVDENAELNHFTRAFSEEAHMVYEEEHPAMLTRDKEIPPFTYLASLSAKWAVTKDSIPSSVQGKIKCILTGVKEFHFKQRTTFELRAYVDDGSLISEVLIDHDVVKNRIGCSPVEVMAALTSSYKEDASNMKEKMKQYQMYLAHFEGTMVVEISRESTIPVVQEMNQGCPASDAWSLLRRLKGSTSASIPRYPEIPDLHPINISP